MKVFTIITFRGGYSHKENLSRNKKLESDVRSLGLRTFSNRRDIGTNVNIQTLNIKIVLFDKYPVIELSLFIPNIKFKDVLNLVKNMTKM